MATWVGREFSSTDTVVADNGNRTFKVWKDLDGFVDPCDRSKGRLLIEPGMDAFLAYLRRIPGSRSPARTSTSSMATARSRSSSASVRTLTAPCWDFDGDPANKIGVLTYVPGAEPYPEAFWNAPLDSVGLLVVTEVDGATLVFESVIAETDGSATRRSRGPRHGPLPRCPPGGADPRSDARQVIPTRTPALRLGSGVVHELRRVVLSSRANCWPSRGA